MREIILLPSKETFSCATLWWVRFFLFYFFCLSEADSAQGHNSSLYLHLLWDHLSCCESSGKIEIQHRLCLPQCINTALQSGLSDFFLFIFLHSCQPHSKHASDLYVLRVGADGLLLPTYPWHLWDTCRRAKARRGARPCSSSSPACCVCTSACRCSAWTLSRDLPWGRRKKIFFIRKSNFHHKTFIWNESHFRICVFYVKWWSW